MRLSSASLSVFCTTVDKCVENIPEEIRFQCILLLSISQSCQNPRFLCIRKIKDYSIVFPRNHTKNFSEIMKHINKSNQISLKFQG